MQLGLEPAQAGAAVEVSCQDHIQQLEDEDNEEEEDGRIAPRCGGVGLGSLCRTAWPALSVVLMNVSEQPPGFRSWFSRLLSGHIPVHFKHLANTQHVSCQPHPAPTRRRDPMALMRLLLAQPPLAEAATITGEQLADMARQTAMQASMVVAQIDHGVFAPEDIENQIGRIFHRFVSRS